MSLFVDRDGDLRHISELQAGVSQSANPIGAVLTTSANNKKIRIRIRKGKIEIKGRKKWAEQP